MQIYIDNQRKNETLASNGATPTDTKPFVPIVHPSAFPHRPPPNYYHGLDYGINLDEEESGS